MSEGLQKQRDQLEKLGYEKSWGRYTHCFTPPYELPFIIRFESDHEESAIQNALDFDKWYKENIGSGDTEYVVEKRGGQVVRIEKLGGGE